MKQTTHLYCVANDPNILSRDLLRSPDIAQGRVPVTIFWHAAGASAAYSQAIATASEDILVFAHQDIYFPEGWFDTLSIVCKGINDLDRCWAAAGVYGIKENGEPIGHVWDSGLGRICGGQFGTITPAVSLDEVVLIIRRSSGVIFDPALPSFHLYGTDIVLAALVLGKKSYVVDLPIIHNTKPIVRFDRSYVTAYKFMVRKWQAFLPWPTVILPLTRNPLPLILRRLRVRYKGIFRSSTLHAPLERPDLKAQELGF